MFNNKYLKLACYLLVFIVENVNFEYAASDECRVSVGG